MASRVRLVDVARNAGVSPTTASLILSGSRADAFASATQKKVHDAARSLGYTRSVLGSSLKSGATRTICFFYTPPMDRFVERFQLHASSRLEEENLHLVSIPVRIGEEQQIVNALSCGLYDTACLACNPTSAKVLMDLLPTPPIPTMIFGTLAPNPSYIGVTIDETAGITQALSSLVKGGAKKIAYLTQRRNADELENEPRWHAYTKFLSDSHLGAPEILAYTEGSIPSAFQCATTIFAGRDDLPDAVYCDSDRVAIGAVLAATQCGIAIPDDLQIIGTGASVDGGDLHPALSTIGLDNQDLDSAVTLLSTLSGEEPESTTLTLRWHYMPRGTTH